MKQKHIWLMLALCLLPLGAVGAITFFKIQVNGVMWFILVALCPLSHVAMIFLMPHMHADQPAKPKPPIPLPPTHDHAAH